MVLKWSRGDTVLLPDFAALVNQRMKNLRNVTKQKQPRTTYTSELRINVTFQLQRTIFWVQR